MTRATQAGMKMSSSAFICARPRPIFGLVFHAGLAATAHEKYMIYWRQRPFIREIVSSVVPVTAKLVG